MADEEVIHYVDQQQQQHNEENNNNRNRTEDKNTQTASQQRKGRGKDYFASLVMHNKVVHNLSWPRNTLSFLCLLTSVLLGLIE